MSESLKVDLQFQIQQQQLKKELDKAGPAIAQASQRVQQQFSAASGGISSGSATMGPTQGFLKQQLQSQLSIMSELTRRSMAGTIPKLSEALRDSIWLALRSGRISSLSGALQFAQQQIKQNPKWATEQDQSGGKNGRRSFPTMYQALLAGVAVGMPGAGAAIWLTRMNPALGAAVIAIRTFEAALIKTAQAAERAREFYAKTLYSGFGTNLTINRSLIAKTIGVGENEVWQFGAAVAAVSPRLQHATEILTKTNPVLTEFGWEMQIVRTDIEALWSAIAFDLAPAFKKFLDWIDELVKKLTPTPKTPDEDKWTQFMNQPDSYSLLGRNLGQARSAADAGILKGIAGAEAGYSYDNSKGHMALPTGFKFSGKEALEAAAKMNNKEIKNLLDKAFGSGKNENYNSKMQFLQLLKDWKSFKPTGAEGAPSPVAYMKQLPASSWERMGLVVGTSGGTNYARDTAKATSKTVEKLTALPAEIANHLRNYMNQNPNDYSLPSLP